MSPWVEDLPVSRYAYAGNIVMTEGAPGFRECHLTYRIRWQLPMVAHILERHVLLFLSDSCAAWWTFS